ncbi:TolC family protein [Granulicella sp. 5B5]|uniref:TolC family protein n=1 Tax=Granulicella sp. 5B5 TaxID=1617967 RepID=UPI0015F59F83|nr:TolC family protein [Granulicella sp. 5B5]QMV18965.1 TolC family protein [Granulicella sp. 5B5]
MTSKWNLLGLAAAAALLSTATSAAQKPSHKADQNLPSAPSAVLTAEHLSAEQRSQLDETLGRPAGNGFKLSFATQTIRNGLTMELPKDDPIDLSLDDAISLGLDRNIRLKYDRANQTSVRGLTLSVVNALIPNLSLNASSNAQEINLAALGFKPSLFSQFASTGLLPPGYTAPAVVKVNTTQANVAMSQVLFNMTDFELYRGTTNETNVVDLQTLTDRGDVVLAVGSLYLQVLGDEANVTNTTAQEQSSKTLYEQAVARQNAGVGVRLDTLRSQVDYQQRQQDHLNAINILAKDKIQLARVLGIPAGQAINLTDKAPFQELAAEDLATAKQTAYAHRKDYLSLLQQDKLDHHITRAVRYQRLPALAFNGNYGVIGITNGNYHGDFTAEGSLTFPIFNEANQRGQQEVAEAQLMAVVQQERSLRDTIDAQIRSAMLDVHAADELVKVAQSNVDLAKQELSDEQDRFSAGVDDSLPVVDAEADVTSAQAQLVQSLYQYNVAKLQLARNTGVIETRYRTYLGH